MTPRDIAKLAFQYQETEQVPFRLVTTAAQNEALSRHYGDDSWKARVVPYISHVTGVDNFLSLAGMTDLPDGSKRDCLGCAWQLGSTHHLVDWPLREPRMGAYRLPPLAPYFQKVRARWPGELAATENQFRVIAHSFGLFERAWSLRGFEPFLMDLVESPEFVEELLDRITEWFLESVDLMAAAPADAIMMTDDHAGQRGMLMGAPRWRQLFKPRWKRIFDRIHRYGLYTVLHMCGDTSEVVPDLIEVGLDCMESCQPECMDIYDLKKRHGRDIRFWGGLGAQSAMPFGTPEEIRKETRRLKRELGRGGGFILAPAKHPGEEIPVQNIAAYLDEACLPRAK